MNLKHLRKLLPVFLVLFFVSCGSEKTEKEDESSIQTDTLPHKENIQKIFYSIPSPIQASLMLKKSGAQYAKEMVNPVENVNRYTTNFKKSVNMGAYGADLAYCNMFNQTQEAIKFLSTVNKLSNSIGMSGIIERAGVLSRFQDNIGNKDSLMFILSDLFRESDEYLKENEQYNTATYVLSGGWVEALYIAVMQAKKNNTKEMRQLIAEQKKSLNSLLNLLPPNPPEKEFGDFKSSLTALQNVFADVSIETGESKVSTDPATNVTTVDAENKIGMTDQVFKNITDKIIAIRTELVK